MISYYIIIIIIIVCTEVYFRFNNTNEQLENNIEDIYTPWIKTKHYNNYTKYYIKIKITDENKLVEWEKIKDLDITYNINNEYLVIKSDTEEKALVIANLFISNMNNEIDFDEIIENDMINISYNKAIKYKFVKTKLIELIKTNLDKLDNTENEVFTNNYYDMNNVNKDIIVNNIINDYSRAAIDTKKDEEEIQPIKIEKMTDTCNSSLNKVDESVIYDIKPQEIVPSIASIQAYGGTEYATFSF
jgi:hypothetical protein